MRIEGAEHAAHGAIHDIVGVDFVDVAGLDRVQCGGECAIVFRNLVVGRGRAASEEPAHEGRDEDREEDRGQGTIASHDVTLADNFLTSNDFWASSVLGTS